MSSIIKALDMLVEYPDLQEYIKGFDGHGGFMFTRETEPHRIDCAVRLEALLDANGMHSGGSWGCLMRSLQAVLTGVVKREQILATAAEEEEHMNIMREKNAELRRQRAAQAEEQAVAEAETQAVEQAEASGVIWRDQPEQIDNRIVNIIKEF